MYNCVCRVLQNAEDFVEIMFSGQNDLWSEQVDFKWECRINTRVPHCVELVCFQMAGGGGGYKEAPDTVQLKKQLIASTDGLRGSYIFQQPSVPPRSYTTTLRLLPL